MTSTCQLSALTDATHKILGHFVRITILFEPVCISVQCWHSTHTLFVFLVCVIVLVFFKYYFKPRQSTRESGKVVSPTHRPPLLLRKYSCYSFLVIVQKDYVNEKFRWNLGNRTRGLRACNAVPQPTAPPVIIDRNGSEVRGNYKWQTADREISRNHVRKQACVGRLGFGM